MKSLVSIVLVTSVLALIAGVALSGTEILNPGRTRVEIEQMTLQNERARAELAYQDELRQIELEKQRELARQEVKVYPSVLLRRAETIEAVTMVVGGTLAGAILALATAGAYYLYKRAKQLELGGQRLATVRGVVSDHRRPQVAKNGDFVLTERAA